MPQFYPEHTPDKLDAFTRGYFDAAEWLLDESVNRDKIRGWRRESLKNGAADCASFQRDNAADLAAYYEESGRDESSAGTDFYLSRCGHGAGFFDRGNAPCFRKLQDAARVYGNVDSDVYRGWVSLS